MRRDVRTDWTVRDDVRAKPAIKLVLEQMESIAPRYAADRI